MPRGYKQPLYILPFDHRGSFELKMFGWSGALTPEQTGQISAAKMVIYDAFKAAVSGGVPQACDAAWRAGHNIDRQRGRDWAHGCVGQTMFNTIVTPNSKDHPWLKEQGDYNLKYLISAALLDGQVGPDQLDPARIQAPDAQAMVARVEVRPDDALTARFPQELAARITVRAKGGSTLVKEHIGYEGGLDQPMSWDRVVEKFHWLSEPFADEKLRSKLVNTVEHLEAQPISALMDLLAHVWPSPVYSRTRAGI